MRWPFKSKRPNQPKPQDLLILIQLLEMKLDEIKAITKGAVSLLALVKAQLADAITAAQNPDITDAELVADLEALKAQVEAGSPVVPPPAPPPEPPVTP